MCLCVILIIIIKYRNNVNCDQIFKAVRKHQEWWFPYCMLCCCYPLSTANIGMKMRIVQLRAPAGLHSWEGSVLNASGSAHAGLAVNSIRAEPSVFLIHLLSWFVCVYVCVTTIISLFNRQRCELFFRGFLSGCCCLAFIYSIIIKQK